MSASEKDLPVFIERNFNIRLKGTFIIKPNVSNLIDFEIWFFVENGKSIVFVEYFDATKSDGESPYIFRTKFSYFGQSAILPAFVIDCDWVKRT